jgi:hypothetical protein
MKQQWWCLYYHFMKRQQLCFQNDNVYIFNLYGTELYRWTHGFWLLFWGYCKSKQRLPKCPGTMRCLNFALVNSMWLTTLIQSENYQHHATISKILLEKTMHNKLLVLSESVTIQNMLSGNNDNLGKFHSRTFVYWISTILNKTET